MLDDCKTFLFDHMVYGKLFIYMCVTLILLKKY